MAPADLAALRERVAACAHQLTPRVRDAARYALEHPGELALNPVAQVAARSGIAASAYIRLAQALGFSGYGELQRLLLAPLQRAAKPGWHERISHHGGEQPIDDAADPAALLIAFGRANRMSLEHLADQAAGADGADALPLAAAIRLLRDAQQVHVLGLRRSFAVAAYLTYALARVGRPCVQITGLGGAILEQARSVRPRDVLLVVSFPPYAADTVAVCEQVLAAGGRSLALTDSLLSPVARGAQVVLPVHDAELLGFRSLTSAMCLAQTLAMGLAFAQPRGRGVDRARVQALQDIDC